jgi:pimeloyl-ACP methyl ester carboxylesterase
MYMMRILSPRRKLHVPISIINIVASWFLGTLLLAAVDLVVDATSYDAEHWFDTDLDHFNFQTRRNISLRYFVDDRFVKGTGSTGSFSTTFFSNHTPVLLYAGNEADINIFIENSGGFMVETAQELQALVVFAEHRYYGHSIPYQKDGSVDLSFLTVEQAMADFNLLTVHLRQKYSSYLTPQSAFIVLGGSYGGNLALWLRLKYPNLWAGAIASSATPLKHILRETNDFARIETEVYGNVSEACPDLVRTGWQELFGNATSQNGRMVLKNSLGLCDPIIASIEEAELLHDWISDALETLVQYGYPYPTAFYEPVPAYPFRVACERMVKSRNGLGALRAAVDVFHNSSGQAGTCYDTHSIIRSLLRYYRKRGDHNKLYHFEKIFKSPKSFYKSFRLRRLLTTEEAWEYQTCTEVYQPMPTNGITDFEIPYTPNRNHYFQRCDERFGVQPLADWEETMFGGMHIEAGSNIFLTHGQLDPWRAAGITKLANQPPSIQIRMIESGAHHYDLRASHPDDVSSVVTVRSEEREAIRTWINQWEQQRSFVAL